MAVTTTGITMFTKLISFFFIFEKVGKFTKTITMLTKLISFFFICENVGKFSEPVN